MKSNKTSLNLPFMKGRNPEGEGFSYGGFTLVEMIVVVGAIGLIMVSIVSIMGGAFKASNRTKWSDLIEQNGSFALAEIRKNILRADGTNLECGLNWVSFYNVNDGVGTTIICESNKIASRSGVLSTDLTGVGVSVVDCSNIISCPTGKVDFNFDLAAGLSEAGPENFVKKNFKTSVGVRN